MQKRILSLMLALAMMITVFAGCGGNTGSSFPVRCQRQLGKLGLL